MKEERYFYVPDASSSDLLPEEERNHALRVLRLGVNDSIFLMDGNGRFYNAVISEISKKHCK